MNDLVRDDTAAPLNRWFWRALSLLLPLALIIYWYAVSRAYLRHDSAEYALQGLRAFQKFHSEGMLSALFELYWERGWKPVFHPTLIFPALLATGGNIRFSVALVNVSIFFLFLYFLRKFVRLFLSRSAAVTATLFVGTLPWVIFSATMFGCETLLLASTMAALYFFLKSDGFKSKKYSLWLGVATGISVISQPFLAIGNFAFPLLFILLRALRDRTIKGRDLELTLPPLLTIFLLLRMQTEYPQYGGRLFAGAFVFILLWLFLWNILIRKWNLSATFYLSYAACLLISFSWLGPFIGKLYRWFMESTFSTVAFHLGNRGDYFSNMATEFGGPFLVIIAGFLLVSWTLHAVIYGRVHSFSDPLIALLPMIVFPPLIGAQTNNKDPRYYYACITVLFLLSSIQAFRLPKGIISAILKTAFSLLAALSIASTCLIVFGKRHSLPVKLTKILSYRRYTFTPVNKTQPLDSFIQGFCRVAGAAQKETIAIALLVNDSPGWVPDESELALFCLEHKINIRIGRPWMLYNEPEKNPPLHLIRENYAYILLGLANRGNYDVWDPQSYRVTNDLLYHYKTGDLSELGLKVLGEFEVGEQNGKYLVLDTNRAAAGQAKINQ